MTLEYLTQQDILIAHYTAISLFGGIAGIRDHKALDSCLHQPQQRFAGKDLYPNLRTKAAAYAFLLCKNHPFIDGNKRTAAIATNTFLALNGYRLSPASGEIERVFLDIAQGKLKIADIANWIKENSTLYSA